jgi:quercetin dioxygenase-like cupin family protein
MEQEENLIPDYNWKSIPVRESRKGIMQRVFRGDDVLVGYSELHPHMDPSPHSHPYEQLFMIVKGRVKLHVGEQVIECTEGSVVRIPPNVVHWAEPPSPEDGVAINMDIWTPYRADFGEFTAYQTDRFSPGARGVEKEKVS